MDFLEVLHMPNRSRRIAAFQHTLLHQEVSLQVNLLIAIFKNKFYKFLIPRHSFFDFEHLTTLKMVAADISEEVLCLPFSNPNLTTLVFIDKGLQGEPAFRRVVKFFPNLKVLEYFSSHPKSGSFLKYLADNLLQLECLRTDLVESGSDFCRLQFNTLKQVAFDGCIMNPEEWNCFVLDNPLVEKLSLNSFVLPAESIACISHYWRQLKEIELGFGCYTADLMHEIADNCLNLKHLKITKEMAVQFKDILAMRAPGIHTFTDDNHFGDNQSFVMNYFLMRKSHAYQTMLNNYNVLAPIWYEDHISSDEAEEGSNGRISSTASVDGAMKYYTEDELLFYNEELDGVVKMDYEIEELSI